MAINELLPPSRTPNRLALMGFRPSKGPEGLRLTMIPWLPVELSKATLL